MANFPNQQLTNSGWDALSEALAGQRLKFTRMVVGDGEMEAGETVEELASRTSLIHYVMDVPITDWRAMGQGKMFITGTLRSNIVATGFRMREIGLYVTLTPLDTEVEGPELLYSINNSGDEYDYVPGRDEGSVVIQAIEVQVLISKAERVEVDVVLGEAGLEGDNLGDGAEVFVERAGNRFRFRTLKGITTGLIPVTVARAGNEITIGAQLGTGGGNGVGGGDEGETAPPNAVAPGVGVVETGMIVPFAGNIAPRGYLIANGRAVSRTGYAGLFAVCGTRYGAGNGTTTFNIPDCRYRSLVGSGALDTDANFNLALGHKGGSPTIALTANNMPSHLHSVDIDHSHSVGVNAHGHGDPSHNHTFNQGWHDHGPHAHNVYSLNQGDTTFAGGQSAHRVTQAGRNWNSGWIDNRNAGANWSGGYNSGAYTGLQNAGNMGGWTNWVSQQQTNWQFRNTDSRGGGEAFTVQSPCLGVNYIIKT